MNTTGCPSGYATDQMFRDNTPLACDVPLVGYYVFYTVLILVPKYATATVITYNWSRRLKMARQERDGKTSPSKRQNVSKFPVMPLFYVVFAFVHTLMMILGGLNIINFRNGAAMAFVALGYFQFFYTYTVGLIRIVRLGDKIIPKAHRAQVDATSLAHFDAFGKMLFTLSAISFATSVVLLIIMGPIFGSRLEPLFYSIGFAGVAGYTLASTLGYVYHFERCIRTIRKVHGLVEGKIQVKEFDELKMAVKRMRATQAVNLVFGMPVFLLCLLLATGAVAGYVWVVLMAGVLESIGSLYYAKNLRGPRNQRNKKDESSTARSGPVQVVDSTSSSKAGSLHLVAGFNAETLSDQGINVDANEKS